MGEGSMGPGKVGSVLGAGQMARLYYAENDGRS